MRIPVFWAEARVQSRQGRKQITVRRLGWSDTSPVEAQAMAQSRAEEALAQAQQGRPLRRMEPKAPYLGAEGVPIREEILARHGEAVLTRNSYGAVCLNVPDALFVDIDFPMTRAAPSQSLMVSVFGIAGIIAGICFRSWPALAVCFVAGTALGILVERLVARARPAALPPVDQALERVRAFAEARPGWLLRVYRTPAGLRLLVMHRPFRPRDPEVAEAFRELGADPAYARLCQVQDCFRARVSPKPWRVGLKRRMPKGTWPVPPEKAKKRQAWVARYEAVQGGYASCRFLEQSGHGLGDPGLRDVQELHDRLCRAEEELPLA